MNVTPWLISDGKASMVWFTAVLEGFLGRPLVNKTGVSGSFKLHLQFEYGGVLKNRSANVAL
jgi:uncharacterized protein (TIGR03435 family)